MIEKDIKIRFDNWLEFNNLTEVSQDIKTVLFEQLVKTLAEGSK